MKRLKVLIVVMSVIWAFLLAYTLVKINKVNILRKELERIQAEYDTLTEELEELSEPITLERDNKRVIFTNYGTWANDVDMTASGLSSKDFEINEDGMFTYEDKVVLATANTTRLSWELKSGYNTHELFEEIEFELNGKKYIGIVVDVCGACFGTEKENYQRYDIFTIDNVVGKMEGIIYV